MVDSSVSIRTIIISTYRTNGQGWVQGPEPGMQNCDVISCFLIEDRISIPSQRRSRIGTLPQTRIQDYFLSFFT